MQVVLHAGAHVTDEDRLINCLVRNRQLLSDAGTEVPNTGSYRKIIRVLLRNAAKAEIDEDARDLVMDAAALELEPDRLILSGPSFLGTPKDAAGGGTLYATAEERVATFRKVFPHDQLELFVAIRNPATFLPAVFENTGFATMDEYLQGADPLGLRWSHLVARLREAHPDLPLTVWCNEDTPLIWAELMREMAGLDPTTALEDEFMLLQEIMTEPGMQRFTKYLASHSTMTEVQKRRVIAAFLDKFAVETAIEEELDVPGWTEELIDQLTEIYDEDVLAIQRMPGVTVITP